ncbi:MAG: biopolymer transporter ExbD [Pseudomonadota bacterium]|jgi:biopolymer transport protein ExbD|nr:MAG: biopolymer transporter ExbD [Pseudomonadota bacterium]
MAFKVGESGADDPMCEVNTVPLIDVMLVLLVMLIITLPVQTHGIKLEMPPPTPLDQQVRVEPERINIEIDPDGTVVVNGNVVPSIPELEAFFQQESLKDPQPEIHMRPSGLALYDVVANVMAAAQRANMVRMGFTNVAEFAD